MLNAYCVTHLVTDVATLEFFSVEFVFLLPGSFVLLCMFFLLRTMLMLLKIVVEYCQVITDIPFVTPEVLNRLVELLKVYLVFIS
jgi:Vps54-like protein